MAKDVRLKTNYGSLTMRIDEEKAPISAANFLRYVTDGHYDGTIFHRVIPTFMLQGGGFAPDMSEKKTHPPIQLESKNGLKNKRGSIAMARTNNPHSATCQFFINVTDNDFLDHRPGNDGYAVFGQVVDGMDVVDKIKMVKTASRGHHDDVPVETVLIESATIVA